MSAFGYDLGLIARPGGAGRMANVRKLMRLARGYERSEGRDLAGFLALAADSTRRDEREGMAPVQAEGHDGVRVMTVHAAKGLEFDVVALPDLGRALDAGRRRGDVSIGTPDGDGVRRFGMRLAFPAARQVGLWELADLEGEESEADADEGCRLVYVGASRARDRLILSGVFKPEHLEPAEPRPGDSPLRRLLPALRERGWDGGEGDVALPGPKPVGGAGRLPDAALRIRISAPSPARAAELVRAHQPPPEPDPLASADRPPPLLGDRPAAVPVGPLSYSALALYERCGYRFYVERVLGARESTAGSTPAGALEDGPATHDRSRALGIGNAVHAALEWSAREGWRRPAPELLELLLRREGLAGDGKAVERSGRLVSAWLDSPLLAELAGARARTEVPFVLALGETVIRGQIDVLLAPAPGGGLATVIDYKTDALDGRAPAELGGGYRAQREIYALAAGGDEGVRVVHVFLEAPRDPVTEVFDAAALERARERLERLVGRMREGDLEPAPDPYPALCLGCPAAARLCPRPAWRPSG
jgi:ATP-dependent exoDNAse (exonuclease V) beta subunit